MRGSAPRFRVRDRGLGRLRDTSYEIQGSKHNKLNGYFKSVVWEGIGSQSSGAPSIGAQAVSLAE